VFLYPLPFFAVLLLPSVKFGEAQGAVAFLSAFACPLMGDTLAYFIGTFFGRHKLCPDISPKKTVEEASPPFWQYFGRGARISRAGTVGTQVPLAALLLLGAACGILGQVGDLFASTIKRWANIKDFGSIFPGHGGILDRIDSVLLCAPAVYLCFFLLNAFS
jgi:phosphatidate cytidylyltransferase